MPDPMRVVFFEPCGPAARRGRRRLRRTMPTFCRRPWLAFAAWAVLMVTACEVAFRHPPPGRTDDRGTLLAIEGSLVFVAPLLVFGVELLPARVRLTGRGVGNASWWLPAGRVRSLRLRRRGGATLLRVDGRPFGRRTFVVPDAARQAADDYVRAAAVPAGAAA